MEKQSTKIKETIVTDIDTNTGAVVSERTYQQFSAETEPDFIKLYLNDIVLLNNLPKASSGILYQILSGMNYENIIVLNKFIRERIANKLNLKLNTVDHAIVNFIEQGLITKIGAGTYFANPKLFARGKWKDIKQLRLSITYNADGRSFELDKELFEQIYKEE